MKYEKLMTHLATPYEKLYSHALYSRITSPADLKPFMTNHAFAVFDFMQLVKRLQNHYAPSRFPWIPPKKMNSAYFINEVVLTEETDKIQDLNPTSHCDLYLMAMRELEIDTSPIEHFIK